jgi:hypothetical protein
MKHPAELFWNAIETAGPKSLTQLQRYQKRNSPEYIIKFIEIGGGPKMGCLMENYSRFCFPNLQKREKGLGETGYDHIIEVNGKKIYIEQKSSGHWGESDYKWQHVEVQHKWNVLLLCGIDYHDIHFWGLSKDMVNQLVIENKITNQGNKKNDSSEGMWFNYTDVESRLVKISDSAELEKFVSLDLISSI